MTAIPDGFTRARCLWGCEAEIFFAKILEPDTLRPRPNPRGRGAAKVPLNIEPCAEGTWKHETLYARGVRWISKGEFVPATERWQGHHVTCPNAQERRPRRIQKSTPPASALAPVVPIRPEIATDGELVLFPKGGAS